ncbi:MAG: cupin domain-containing protein [Saccharofermentans sp.]|nr:cupin domain-containing protein [Saccharofermentans sp.]
MVIDYNAIEWKENPEFKGGKGVFFNKAVVDGNGKMMMGRLTPGSSIGYHTHEGNAETIYIISGSGIELSDGVECPAVPGNVHYCADGHSHSLMNCSESEDLVFFAVIK